MTSDRHADDELIALVAFDALDAAERTDAERELGILARSVADTVATLADTAATPPPSDLRGATIASALDRRAANRPVDATEPCTPLDAYRRTADNLHRLLATLADTDWNAPAHDRHGSVRAVVAHLVGVEQLVLGWVGAAPAPDPATTSDHVEATRALVEQLAGEDPRVVTDRWFALTRAVEAACRAADADRRIVAHDLPTDVEGLLVLRAFELLAHTHDLCTAARKVAIVPDPATLALMSSRLMAALPFALALRGTTAPGRTARIVLTGDGDTARAGGCYDVALDPASSAGPPDVTITADVNDMCLLAARRIRRETLDVAIDGDDQLAAALLDSVDAFARD